MNEYSESELKQELHARLMNGGIEGQHGLFHFNFIEDTYYDSNAQVFFLVIKDGDYYHGYEVSYWPTEKEKVLVSLEEQISFRPQNEIFFEIAFVKSLPECPERAKNYHPPIHDVGKGILYY